MGILQKRFLYEMSRKMTFHSIYLCISLSEPGIVRQTNEIFKADTGIGL